jgi:hypothetical protein
MSILIDSDTTFIIQGITGREAVNMTRHFPAHPEPPRRAAEGRVEGRLEGRSTNHEPPTTDHV